MSSDLKHKFRRGVRWSFAGAVGSASFQFLQTLVFARLAGPAAAGDYALAATITGFLTPLAEAGLSQAVVQAETLHPRQLATLAWVNFGLGIAVFGVLWWSSAALAGWYGRPDLEGLLPLMGLSLLAMPFGASSGGLMVREFRFNAIARIEILASAAGFLALSALASMGWGVWAMASAFLSRQAVVALANFWHMRRTVQIDWFRPATLRSVWPHVRFGSFDVAARWSDFLANYLDKLIVGKWLGATALGYYNLAFTLCVLPTARLGYLVTRVSFPVFARMRHDNIALRFFFQQTARDLILLLFPVYLGLALFSTELIVLFYGRAWLPAAPLVTAFAVGGWVRSLNALFPQLTKGTGKPQLLMGWMLLWTLAVNLALAVFLLVVPSVESAAWSRVAAKYSVELALLFWLARACGVAFGPVLKYAARVLGYLLPVACAVLLVSFLNTGFYWNLIFKAAMFATGLSWIGWGTALRTDLLAKSRSWRRRDRD